MEQVAECCWTRWPNVLEYATWQGWLSLAVVVDLYARKVVGWSMKPSLAKEIVS